MYQYKEILILLRKTIEKWTDILKLMRQKNYLIYLTLQFTLLLQAKIFWCISHCSEGLLWVMSRRRSTKTNGKYLHMQESQMHPSPLSYSVQNSFLVYWVCVKSSSSKNIMSVMPCRNNMNRFLKIPPIYPAHRLQKLTGQNLFSIE